MILSVFFCCYIFFNINSSEEKDKGVYISFSVNGIDLEYEEKPHSNLVIPFIRKYPIDGKDLDKRFIIIPFVDFKDVIKVYESYELDKVKDKIMPVDDKDFVLWENLKLTDTGFKCFFFNGIQRRYFYTKKFLNVILGAIIKNIQLVYKEDSGKDFKTITKQINTTIGYICRKLGVKIEDFIYRPFNEFADKILGNFALSEIDEEKSSIIAKHKFNSDYLSRDVYNFRDLLLNNECNFCIELCYKMNLKVKYIPPEGVEYRELKDGKNFTKDGFGETYIKFPEVINISYYHVSEIKDNIFDQIKRCYNDYDMRYEDVRNGTNIYTENGKPFDELKENDTIIVKLKETSELFKTYVFGFYIDYGKKIDGWKDSDYHFVLKESDLTEDVINNDLLFKKKIGEHIAGKCAVELKNLVIDEVVKLIKETINNGGKIHDDIDVSLSSSNCPGIVKFLVDRKDWDDINSDAEKYNKKLNNTDISKLGGPKCCKCCKNSCKCSKDDKIVG